MHPELEKLLRMIEGKITRALLDRDGAAHGHWSRRKKWVKEKTHLHGDAAHDVIKEELLFLAEEYAQIVPSQHPAIVEHRALSTYSVTEMLRFLP
jgi:hypothetical protein